MRIAHQGDQLILQSGRLRPALAWTAGALSLAAVPWAWQLANLFAYVLLALSVACAMVASYRRATTFDKAGGIVQLTTRWCGIGKSSTIPMFHLRAVIIRHAANQPSRFELVLQRRIASEIAIATTSTQASVQALAKQISQHTGLRVINQVWTERSA